MWRGGGPLRFCAGYAIIYAFPGIEYPRRWGYSKVCGGLSPKVCIDVLARFCQDDMKVHSEAVSGKIERPDIILACAVGFEF